jgi:uncharacterized protein
MSTKLPTVPAPLPRTQDPMDEEFWRQCQDGRLRFQKCDRCGAWRFLPRYMCARCGSPDFAWTPVRGAGSLYSWTITHQALHPAFAADIPYIAALVELDEGVRMATRLLNCDRATLELGLRVELIFREIGEGFQLPCFQPTRMLAASKAA